MYEDQQYISARNSAWTGYKLGITLFETYV